MSNQPDRAARAAYFHQLRELHKLWDKHEVAREYLWRVGPWSLAVCACGKLLVRPAPLHNGVWKPANHATKRALTRHAGVRKWLKELRNERENPA